MAKWTTATSISRRYLVGLERLLDYSRRGNLPKRTDSDGTVLYDEDIVQHFFRLRRSSLSAPSENLGVLGESRLNALETSHAPALRHSMPVSRVRESQLSARARTGTDDA